MADLDPAVASILDSSSHAQDDDQDEDAILAALESDDVALTSMREQRLQQLHEEMSRARSRRNEGFGTYQEVTEETHLMEKTTSAKWVVVHFFKMDFHRCSIMDAHLEALAPKHFDTNFLRINVENAPFLVTRLKIKVLPCVLAFMDGISVERVTGFEGLGNGGDSFQTSDLEARLLRAGVLQRVKAVKDAGVIRGSAVDSRKEESDEDEDWY
ncbi:MAG: hypothetical protein M1837_001723 [Sclerophora amabilis]|nr:MAG: hypothetical protein M1837_001723 [Sclerophora amabilis]